MKRIILGLIGLLIIAGYLGYRQMAKPPAPMVPTETLRIDQGIIYGGIDRDNPAIQQFNGIPFAKADRWRAPGPAPQWGAQVRDTRAFGAECVQPREGLIAFVDHVLDGAGLSWPKRQLAKIYMSAQPVPAESEDCLFLNVRTDNRKGTSLKPVMVWIHGGSHQTGAGSSTFYQTNGLVENGVVLVTINYRLGPFGYLAHPALTAEAGTSGNYGLMDQISALKWVQKNIAQFGGDPDNVTIFGESAGAQSVSEIMAAPSGDGLYHKAILESGTSSYNAIHLKDSPVSNVRSAESVGADLLSPAVSETASAADLRAIPTAQVSELALQRPDLTGYYLPVVDGKILPRMIGQSIQDGSVNHVPILAGYNSDEATLFYDGIQSPTILKSPITGTLKEREAAFAEAFGLNRAKALQALYGMDSDDNWPRGATDMLGDDLFGVHMRFLGKKNAEAGQPTWLYFFTRVSPSKTQTIGAYHAAEISFVFDSHLPISPLTPEDLVLTQAMGQYWTNFAKTGNPNSDGLTTWPAYSVAGDDWLELGDKIKPRQALRARKLDIIEEVLEERIAQVQSAMGPFEVPTPIEANIGSGSQQDIANGE